jgi:hypothetical protein
MLSVSLVKLLRKACTNCNKNISEDLFDVFIECLTERSKLRKVWRERYNDPVFEMIPADERPLSCSCLDHGQNVDMEKCLAAGQMPRSLDDLVEKIRAWRLEFVQANQCSGNETAQPKIKKRKKNNAGSLTKKEQKRVASNWEMLKRKI